MRAPSAPCRRVCVSKRKPDALRCFLFCQSWKSAEPPFSPTVSPSDTTTILKKTHSTTAQIKPENRRITPEPRWVPARGDGTGLRRGIYTPERVIFLFAFVPLYDFSSFAHFVNPKRSGFTGRADQDFLSFFFKFFSFFHFFVTTKRNIYSDHFTPLYLDNTFIINNRDIFF